MRCTQINRIGEQCRDQAVAGSELCAFHAGILEGRSSSRLDEDTGAHAGQHSRFPFIYRLAAGLLLLIFLLEIVQLIKGWFR